VQQSLVDTNVLPHYQPIDKIDWTSVVPDVSKVRLVIPLLVLEELDRKRHEAGDSIQRKAPSAVQPLDRIHDSSRSTATPPSRTAAPSSTCSTRPSSQR
jgi:predicted ribonuclease YlaK